MTAGRRQEGAAAFAGNVAAALAYWDGRTRGLTDAGMWALDAERQNLFRAVQFGLRLPELWPVVAAVTLQVHALVEQRGYWAEWNPVLEAVVGRCPDRESAIMVRLLNRQGQLYRHMSQLEQAIIVHRCAEQVAEKLADGQLLAEARCDLSHDYVASRQYDAAEAAGRAALAGLAGAAGAKRRFIPYALQALAAVARAHGEYALAEDYLTEAVAACRDSGHPGLLAGALTDLGHALRAGGKLDQAIARYREAADRVAGSHYELGWCAFTANIGVAYFEKGDYAAAEAAFRRADTPYLRRSGHLRQRAALIVSLGNVLLKQGRLAEAAAYLRESMTLWRECGDDLELANATGSLGEVLAAQGDPAAARPHFEEAIRLLGAFPDHVRARRLQAFFAGELARALARMLDEDGHDGPAAENRAGPSG